MLTVIGKLVGAKPVSVCWEFPVFCTTLAQYMAHYKAAAMNLDLQIHDLHCALGKPIPFGRYGVVDHLLSNTVVMEQVLSNTCDADPSYAQWLSYVIQYRADELDAFPGNIALSGTATPVCWYDDYGSSWFFPSTAIRELLAEAFARCHNAYLFLALKQAEAFIKHYGVALDYEFERGGKAEPLRLTNG